MLCFREGRCCWSGSCLMQSRVSWLPARTPLIPLWKIKALFASGAVFHCCLQLQLPHKAKFERGSVASNPLACSPPVEILCMLPLSPMPQAHEWWCLFGEIFLSKIHLNKVCKTNWFTVLICKLVRKVQIWTLFLPYFTLFTIQFLKYCPVI